MPPKAPTTINVWPPSHLDAVCGAEEEAYWDTDGKRPQQHHHALPPTTTTTSADKSDRGLMSKLTSTEIGAAYENLTKTIGGQAKNLGDQAKIFGEHAKGYTLANTSTAAATMNRFKKQIASAVDGVPQRPDDEHFRERGTTTAKKEKAGSAEDSQGLLQGTTETGQNEDEDAEVEHKDGVNNGRQRDLAEEKATAPAAKAGTDAKRLQVDGGMVDENAPVLSFGAIAAAFKKKPAGGATVTQAQAAAGGGHGASSGAVVTQQSDSAASGGGNGGGGNGGGGEGGGNRSGGEILPRTASLVGGRQWAVLASVYDTTASVLDETVGDLFT